MQHTVVRGDTLWGIARRYGFRYWPNLYYAWENTAFRRLRPDPDRIVPGDVVTVPAPDQVIAALESRPAMRHGGIPLFPQPTPATCWRAAAKMVFLWRHGPRSSADFDRRIGASYRTLDQGLPRTRWNDLYCSRLGMMHTNVNCENLLHYIVAIRGPAIVAGFSDDANNAHAMVMAGYNLLRLQWYVLNPFSGAGYDFEEQTITVNRRTGAATTSGGDDASFTPAVASESTMGQWLNIRDTGFRSEVFHY